LTIPPKVFPVNIIGLLAVNPVVELTVIKFDNVVVAVAVLSIKVSVTVNVDALILAM
jgi:hypothetical protein